MQDLIRNPTIGDIASGIVRFAKEKPIWTIAGVAAITVWGMQLTGNLVTPPNIKRYVPGSQDAKDLFKFSASKYGLDDWSEDPDLHWIMTQESGGWVGKPNYTYGVRKLDKNLWPSVWDELKAGKITAKSSATGLGQLKLDNANKYYPDGANGIGDPVNEATGFMRYILDRYGSPSVARSVYGKIGDYVHVVSGKSCHKGFQEGY